MFSATLNILLYTSCHGGSLDSASPMRERRQKTPDAGGAVQQGKLSSAQPYYQPFFRFWYSIKNIFDCVHPRLCGWFLDTQKACTCAPVVVTKYQKRNSGPLLDCIYTHIEVPLERFNQIGNAAGTNTWRDFPIPTRRRCTNCATRCVYYGLAKNNAEKPYPWYVIM